MFTTTTAPSPPSPLSDEVPSTQLGGEVLTPAEKRRFVPVGGWAGAVCPGVC